MALMLQLGPILTLLKEQRGTRLTHRERLDYGSNDCFHRNRGKLRTTTVTIAVAGYGKNSIRSASIPATRGSGRHGPRPHTSPAPPSFVTRVATPAAPTTPTPAPQEPLPPPPYPRSIHEISNGDRILGFGADLGEDHPGFHDEEYKRRRMEIVGLARTHVMGQAIPRVGYTPEETAVYGAVLEKLEGLYPTHACKEFLAALPLFGFSTREIPQLEDVSQVLRARTGWQIRPVAGLLHPRDFLNGLAFRVFHSTQYIRHACNPQYTPEPDVCHELLGHVPMLADLEFAELARAIGVASLGASEKDIWHLTKLYWYTVEFGTVMEEGEVKAFGAGLLSSFGELEYMRAGDAGGRKPEFVELDPFGKLPKMSYKDGFQSRYFLCGSFKDVAEKLRAYAKTIQRPDVLLL